MSCVPATTAALWAVWEEKLENTALRREMTKSEFLGLQLKMICEEKGIFAEVSDAVFYMTTVSGEWYFNLSEHPIKLFHRNHQGIDGFHIQEKNFSTPLKVIAYIQKHDYSYMKAKYLNIPERKLVKELENVPRIQHPGQYLM